MARRLVWAMREEPKSRPSLGLLVSMTAKPGHKSRTYSPAIRPSTDHQFLMVPHVIVPGQRNGSPRLSAYRVADLWSVT